MFSLVRNTGARIVQQLEHVEPGRLEWREVREPKLAGYLDALVRPIAVARCDLDTLMYSGEAPSVTPCAYSRRALARGRREAATPAAIRAPGQLTTATASISISSSGRARRTTCTRLLAGSGLAK